MPKGFSYPADAALWTTAGVHGWPSSRQVSGPRWYLTRVSARVKPGVTLEQVGAEVRTIGDRLAAQYPDVNAGVGLTAVPLHEAMVGDIRRAVLVLARRGRIRAPHRLHERREPAAGACGRARRRDGGQQRARRRTRTARPSAADRERDPVAVGGGLGLLVAIWGVDAADRASTPGYSAARRIARSIGSVMAVHGRPLASHRSCSFGVVPALQATGRVGRGHAEGRRPRRAVDGRGGSARCAARWSSWRWRCRGAARRGGAADAQLRPPAASVDPGFTPNRRSRSSVADSDSSATAAGEPSMRSSISCCRAAGAPWRARARAPSRHLPLRRISRASRSAASCPSGGRSGRPARRWKCASRRRGYFGTIGIPPLKRGRAFHGRGSTPVRHLVVIIDESAARRLFPGRRIR